MVQFLANSTVQIFDENNVPVTEKIKAIVVKDAIRIFDPPVKVMPGFYVRHFIKIGDDDYRVVEANYNDGVHGAIPPSYELTVKNIKSFGNKDKKLEAGSGDIVKTSNAARIVNNTYHLGANGKIYQDSNDYSVNSIIQNTNNYSQVINQLREEIKTLDLKPDDSLISEKILQNIEEEASQGKPNGSRIKTLISLLPEGVQALSSVAELVKIFVA